MSLSCEAWAGQWDPRAAVATFLKIWIRLYSCAPPVHLHHGLFCAQLRVCH